MNGELKAGAQAAVGSGRRGLWVKGGDGGLTEAPPRSSVLAGGGHRVLHKAGAEAEGGLQSGEEGESERSRLAWPPPSTTRPSRP